VMRSGIQGVKVIAGWLSGRYHGTDGKRDGSKLGATGSHVSALEVFRENPRRNW